MLARREQGVEQELAVLGPAIALATTGRRARTSSPSMLCTRGKTPSSRPTRHTTRCGTERIGTMVQTVRVPVRKLARVGRPASRACRRARTSASRSGTSPPASSALARARASSRSSCGSCHASSSLTAHRSRTPSARVSNQSAAVRARLRRSRHEPRRATASLSRPTSSISPLPTSSSGSPRPRWRCSSPLMATPSRSRSRPTRQVLCSKAPRPKDSRPRASMPHRTPASATQPEMRARSSSVRSKRCRHTGRARRSSTSGAVARPPASSTSVTATASSGLVLLTARSARRTRNRWAG